MTSVTAELALVLSAWKSVCTMGTSRSCSCTSSNLIYTLSKSFADTIATDDGVISNGS
jgi:hypothetical protein